MQVQREKLLILGSGPAGYTAAIYAARAMLDPLIIAGMQQGGQMTITTDVENYPGFANVIQGPWLMEQMKEQAVHMGARVMNDHIVDVDLSRSPFRLVSDRGQIYDCDALIICTGAQARWLGIPSEQAFKGFGVSACATCDGFFYRDKNVLVVGGGNTAVEEALFLTKFAARVTLVHRRDSLRAERILQNRLFENSRIDVKWNCELDEVIGDKTPPSVTGAILRDVKTGSKERIDASGIFIAIGHAPATELFKDQLPLSPSGYLITAPRSTATDIAGVFAAGDVTDDIYRQAVTAAGMGCMAALECEKFLTAREMTEKTRN